MVTLLRSTENFAACVLKDLIAVHDVRDFLITVVAQRCGHESQSCASLVWSEIAESQSVALKNPARKIGPSGALAAIEGESGLGSFCAAQTVQKGIRRGHDFSVNHGSAWIGRLLTGSLHETQRNRNRKQDQQRSPRCLHEVMVVQNFEPKTILDASVAPTRVV